MVPSAVRWQGSHPPAAKHDMLEFNLTIQAYANYEGQAADSDVIRILGDVAQ
jgi:hypothetical protein